MDCVSRGEDTDRLACRILAELDAPDSATEIAARIQTLLAESESHACPIRLPAKEDGRGGLPPAPFAVALVVGRIRESRALYRAAKILSAEGAGSGASIRKELSRKSLTMKSRFPQPVRSLAASLAGDGVDVEIRADGAAAQSAEPGRQAPLPEAGPFLESVPRASLVPLKGLPTNLRRLRALAGILYSGEDPPNLSRIAKETVLAAALVAANLIGAEVLLLLLLAAFSSLNTLSR